MGYEIQPTQLRMFRKAVYAAVLSCVALAAAGAETTGNFPGIQELMTQAEFDASGLQKLDPAELEALNRWLLHFTAGEADFMRVNNEEVKTAAQDVAIEGKLINSFEGWSGKTVFYLDNGQVWQQRQAGTYRYRGELPEVVIEKNFLGFWAMTLKKEGMGVGVKRIQ